jgi:hypothetical protein
MEELPAVRFVRVTVSHTQNRVVAVMEQDTPFRSGGRCLVAGEECETFDLGVVEDQPWALPDGTPCSVTRHLLERLESESPDVRCIHDVPCTLEGIRARLRERGPTGIPVKVRAWLATVLPEPEVRAMGIAAGIPIAALKACEAIRARRDPSGGSRAEYFERIAQRQHETRRVKIERDIRRRSDRELAASQAFEEMRASIERAGVADGIPQVR